MSNGDTTPLRWSMVAKTLNRPYPVSFPMVMLVLLVPFYIFIGEYTANRSLHAPALNLDRLIPLQPSWALIYGSLYLFLIVLPVFIVSQKEQIRCTVFAYLMVWIVAYICFLIYPTFAPRPENVIGEGFSFWGLRFLYSADPPYNCFPSLHVAHSCVSALTCYRVHRGVGIGAGICAVLIGISTLFTKQHYILDVIAGILLAYAAYLIFLRNRSIVIPEVDGRIAPVLTIGIISIIGLGVVACWIVYRFNGVN